MVEYDKQKIIEEVYKLRNDEEFMARLKERINEDKPILDRLTTDRCGGDASGSRTYCLLFPNCDC